MIPEIRTYFQNRIVACDPDLKQLDDPIGDDNVDSARQENYYKLVFGDMETLVNDGNYSENIPVTLTIHSGKGRESENISRFDNLYDKAILLKNDIINPIQSKNQTDFTEVLSNGITPAPFTSNDKVFQMTLQFTVSRDFNFC